MKGLVGAVEYVQGAADAIGRGLRNLIEASPQLTRQHIEQLARQRLHSTRENYMSAVDSKVVDYALVVTLDPENWLAHAVEEGVDPFNLKQMLSTSKKVRISKEGFRYLRIPIGKEKGGSGGPSQKGQDLQKKINQVLERPKFGMTRLKALHNGTVIETQRIQSADPQLKGLYRTRQHASAQAYHDKRSRPAWQVVLFRTMSEKPGTSKWLHPGIKPVAIFRDTEQWIVQAMPDLLDSFVGAELEAFNKRFEQGL